MKRNSKIKTHILSVVLAVVFVFTTAFTVPLMDVSAADKTTTVIDSKEDGVSLIYNTINLKKGKTVKLKAIKAESIKKNTTLQLFHKK